MYGGGRFFPPPGVFASTSFLRLLLRIFEFLLILHRPYFSQLVHPPIPFSLPNTYSRFCPSCFINFLLRVFYVDKSKVVGE